MKTQFPKFVSLDEAFSQDYLNDLIYNEYEGILHEREYVDEIPMSDALDNFLKNCCNETLKEDEHERVCGIW